MDTTLDFVIVSTRLGVHYDTTRHRTQAAARRAFRATHAAADSAAIYGPTSGSTPVEYLGTGR